MALGIYQDFVVDQAGNTQNGALIEIRNEATGNLATLYSDRDGSHLISNPMTADATGFFQFFVVGGAYKLTITSGSGTRILRYVPIGLLRESDGPIRELLTNDRTYYVRTDGSDNNNGLTNSAGGAFLTIQKALNVVFGTVDLNGYNVTIQIGNGTYTNALSVSNPQVGAGNITLSGDTTTPSNVHVNPGGSLMALTVSGAGTRLYVKGIKFSGAACINVRFGGFCGAYGKVEYGTASGHQILIEFNGIFDETGYSSIISGGAAGGHYYMTSGGIIYSQAHTCTITGSPTLGVFAWASVAGLIYSYVNTYTGTITCKRYLGTGSSVVLTNGGGANYFPGNVAGSVDATSYYA